MTRCGKCNFKCSQKVKYQMDQLWSDHFWLTREVVRDAVAQSPCLEVDLNDLLLNQDQLGANFGKIVRSTEAAEKLAAALREHINIAVQIVVAAINQQPIDALYAQWVENAKEIARIYSEYSCGAIKYSKILQMMIEHLDTTLAEAVSIISGDCQESSNKGKIALAHVHMMSKYLICSLCK